MTDPLPTSLGRATSLVEAGGSASNDAERTPPPSPTHTKIRFTKYWADRQIQTIQTFELNIQKMEVWDTEYRGHFDLTAEEDHDYGRLGEATASWGFLRLRLRHSLLEWEFTLLHWCTYTTRSSHHGVILTR